MRGDFACPRPNSRRISVWGRGHVGIDERRIKADASARGQVDKVGSINCWSDMDNIFVGGRSREPNYLYMSY